MKYPIGIQDFEKIREDGFVYVDKTALLYDLVTNGTIYFLGRPRRFGKSLLVSTLENYFLGKKELFKGLAIDSLEKEWKEHPVFHISFATSNFTNYGALETTIDAQLSDYEKIYGNDAKAMREPCGRVGFALVSSAVGQRRPFVGIQEHGSQEGRERLLFVHGAVFAFKQPEAVAVDGLVGGSVHHAHHIAAAELHLLHLGLCLCAAVEHLLVAGVLVAAERRFESGESHCLAIGVEYGARFLLDGRLGSLEVERVEVDAVFLVGAAAQCRADDCNENRGEQCFKCGCKMFHCCR